MKTSLASPEGCGARLASAVLLLAAFALAVPGTVSTAWAQRQPARESREPVTLNFVNADIEAVSRAMAAVLNRQILVDPRVKGTITLYSETPLSPREAYLNYQAALRGLGFAVVEVAGVLKVVPEADAKLQTGTVAVGAVPRQGDQVMTQIFRLQHENANNLVTVLRPLISPNNTINANPSNNTLVITDYADNLQRISKIIAAMDLPGAADVEVIPVQHGSAGDLAPLVQRLADAGGGGLPGVAPGVPGAIGGAGGGALTIVPDARTNTLLVRAPNAARLNTVRALVAKLDRPIAGSGAGGNIYVVYLKNADAVRLAQVLRAAYGAGGGAAAPATPTPSSTAALGGAAGQAGGAATGAASPQATAPVQGSAAPSTGGFVQADPATNSLIITAPEPVYRQMRAVIDQLDSRRAQVYIESLIVEVSGDNAADFGFQWLGAAGQEGDKNIPIVVSNFGSGNSIVSANVAARSNSAAAVNAIGEGLTLGLVRNFSGTYALAAIARALQTQTNTNILSTPNLVTLDNEEAKIIVGENVPFITGQFTSTGTGTTNPFQTIERKDVGLTLRIRPQIGEGGTVRMVIYQEQSSVKDRAAVGTSNAGPSTDKRSIESTVVVDDGQVVVLGGLVQDRFTESRSKVPLLGDIPLLGALFRSENRTKTRTNLMVFLRPVVLRDADSANKLSLDRYDIIRGQQQNAQPSRSIVVPINESPVLPEIPREGKPAVEPLPIGPPASAPSAPR